MKRDPLADVPPGEFVAARNALVKELRAAGKTAEAKAIAARRRPSPSVWAVNQVARARPEVVGDLVAAGKALATAQRGLLRGGGVEAMRQAEAGLRAALGAVDRELGDLSAAARGRAMDTLRAAATGDDATRAALRAGQLEEDLEAATGFEALGAVRLPKQKKAPPKKPSAEEKRAAREREKRERQLARLRAEAQAAEERAQRLRERAEEAAASLGA